MLYCTSKHTFCGAVDQETGECRADECCEEMTDVEAIKADMEERKCTNFYKKN
jgi:hypothetical protein